MKTAICVIIKDENEYLDEWLTHHLNLGIDEIYLYEDYGSKSHLDIVKSYGDRVHLNSIDIIFNSYNIKNNRSKKNKYSVNLQIMLFDYFPKLYKDKFDWILFNDLDEFLILKEPLHKLLKEYDDKPGILLKWRYYSASGNVNKPIGKVVDNFKKYISTTFDYGYTFKSFINCKKFIKWNKLIHEVEGGVYPLYDWGGHKAWINHYFTKSWEEWKIKLLKRGDIVTDNRKITYFFSLNKDMIPIKKDLLLSIAIDNATKIGFNKNKGNKYIHLCLFGGKQLDKNYILSLKQQLSDDFIVCIWNENCFDLLEIPYIKDCYNFHCWEYISDYVGLWSVYNFGGVYFNIDIELLKYIDNLPITNNFLTIDNTSGLLTTNICFGSESGNIVVGEILNIYEKLEFNKCEQNKFKNSNIVTNYFSEKINNLKKFYIFDFLDL